MKSNKDFQPRTGRVLEADDLVRKSATKLEPNKKSGKDKHRMFAEADDDEDDFMIPAKKESVFDYYDDVPEDDEDFDDDYDDDFDDEDDDDDDYED